MSADKPTTALVTGAARGLGLETARILSRDNQHVSLIDLDLDALRTASRQLTDEGVQCEVRQADVTDNRQVEEAVAGIERERAITVLVNNAAIHELTDALDIAEDAFHRMLNVNVIGTHLVTAAVLTRMIERQKGAIVSVASLAGLRGHPVNADRRGGACHYAASKGAVIAYTKSLAKEFGPLGIRANCVAPGMMATPMNASSYSAGDSADYAAKIPLGRIGQPSEVAEAIGFLASPRASYVTGQVLNACGGSYIA